MDKERLIAIEEGIIPADNETYGLPKLARLFYIGVTASQGKYTDRELAILSGLQPSTVKQAKRIAEQYNKDFTQFKLDYMKSNAKSWNEFYRKKYVTEVMTADKKESYVKKLFDIVKEEKRDGFMNERMLNTLKAMQKLLNLYIPTDIEIKDKQYLTYADCSCCGIEAEEKGNKLIRDKLTGILYTACDKCIIEETPPNWTLVALIYSKYCNTLETGYNELLETWGTTA